MTLSEMLRIFLVPWGWPFLAYVALQLYVPVRVWGTRWFKFSMLPLPAAAFTLWVTYEAGREGGNQWPLLLILGGGGLAAIELCILLEVADRRRRARR